MPSAEFPSDQGGRKAVLMAGSAETLMGLRGRTLNEQEAPQMKELKPWNLDSAPGQDRGITPLCVL